MHVSNICGKGFLTRDTLLEGHWNRSTPCKREIRSRTAIFCIFTSSCLVLAYIVLVLSLHSSHYYPRLSTLLLLIRFFVEGKYVMLVKLLGMQLVSWAIISLMKMKHDILVREHIAELIY